MTHDVATPKAALPQECRLLWASWRRCRQGIQTRTLKARASQARGLVLPLRKVSLSMESQCGGQCVRRNLGKSRSNPKLALQLIWWPWASWCLSAWDKWGEDQYCMSLISCSNYGRSWNRCFAIKCNQTNVICHLGCYDLFVGKVRQ